MIHEKTRKFSANYDVIICTAGGFELGNLKDMDIMEKYEKMQAMNLQSSLLTAHLAANYLGEQGFLCLTGAAAAFEKPLNHAFAYGIAK